MLVTWTNGVYSAVYRVVIHNGYTFTYLVHGSMKLLL